MPRFFFFFTFFGGGLVASPFLGALAGSSLMFLPQHLAWERGSAVGSRFLVPFLLLDPFRGGRGATGEACFF